MSMRRSPPEFFFFFFNDTATTEIYTLSLHDALPICHRAYIAGRVAEGGTERAAEVRFAGKAQACGHIRNAQTTAGRVGRSEEHTSELQSPCNLVCRLLLEKKNERHPE